jgi:hypothetical protein
VELGGQYASAAGFSSRTAVATCPSKRRVSQAGVLDAIARALQLDDAERTHLLHLAHEADGSNAALRRRRPKPEAIRPGLRAPRPGHPPNFARFTFLDAAARRFFPDWDLAADMCVANLRTATGKDPHDKGLHDLVGELSTRNDEFRRRWETHNVRTHGSGVKHFGHHVVGELVLAYEGLDLRAEPDLTMTNYAAEPDSPTVHALTLLASWAAATTETSPTAIPTVAPGLPGRVGSVDV